MRVTPLKTIPRRLAAGLLFASLLALPLCGQTLQQAESLWKARQYQEANAVFRDLVAKNPKNPDYRVRWGRMFLEHAQAKDIETATDLFNEALQIKKDCAGALLGLALIAADNYGGNAATLAQKALEADPKLVEAQELLARLALEDNNNGKASEEAHKALALDKDSIAGKAILATMDWLADKKDSTWDPHAAKGYEIAGHFFMLNRRYEESIEFYRKALALDPDLNSARSQLGLNLMRLGRNDEAYQQLKAAWDNHFQDSATKNTLTLMDSYTKFVTFQTDRTILKMDKREADLLRPYFEEEMERCIATYEKKYKFKLEHPVQVEVYPDHEDFAVRTLGMPGLGALGVTFGYVIAMDSPSGRPPGQFHWASTMWHEMSHVFTLTMTRSHVPRWFTEGIAVHEETAASPEWGDRLGPDEISAIKNKQLLSISELDRGFIHPQSPTQVIVSYFQAGRIVDYITNKWGWDAVLAMLKDFSADVKTSDVIRKELKIEPDAFDQQFLAWVEEDTKTEVSHFAEWREAVKKVAELARNKDYDGVIKAALPVRDLYPDYVEGGSVYEFLATAYRAKNDKAAAIDELERYMKAGGRSPDSLKLLAQWQDEGGNKKEAAAVLERLNMIYPVDYELHQRLGALSLSLKMPQDAIREFQAVLANHPIDAAQAHYDLAMAYKLNHQTDKAKDEALASLEIAPGFRPAQKLLLELNDAEGKGTPHVNLPNQE
jgi:tetratricopeptide (TPR) repeat protein